MSSSVPFQYPLSTFGGQGDAASRILEVTWVLFLGGGLIFVAVMVLGLAALRGPSALRHFLSLERPDHVDVADAELFSRVCECRPLTATPATLMAEPKSEQQKAVFAGSFPLDLEDPGANIVYAIANMGVNPSDLEKSMNDVIAEVQTNLVSDREFQKLLNQVESDFVTANNTMAGIAESLANYEMYYGDASLINNELSRYRAVTREDLRNAAKKYFNKNARVVLYWLPMQAKP